MESRRIQAVVRKDDVRGTIVLHVYESDGWPTRTYEFELGEWSRLVATKSVEGLVWAG